MAMPLLQQSDQAIKAAATAESQFAQLLQTLELSTVGEKLGVKVTSSDKTSARITVLAQPYILRCRLLKLEEGRYETKVVLVREFRNGTDEVCHSILVDDLGNMTVDPTAPTRMHTITQHDDIRWLCRSWVLIEASHDA